MNKPLLILMLAALAGCGSGDGKTAKSTQQTTKGSLPDDLAEKLNGILKNTKCTMEDCELVEIESKQQDPVRPDIERILVIDTALILPSLTRYKKRTAAIYSFDRDTGLINEYQGSIKVSKDAIDFYNAIQDYPKHIPVALTNPLSREFRLKFSAWLHVEGVFDKHGRHIFNYVADKNPDNELVAITDFYNIYPSSIQCNLDEPENYEAALNQVVNVVSDLRGLVKKWNVKYINLSAGSDADRFYHNFKKVCENKVNAKMMQNGMRIWETFLSGLSSIDGTYLIQAGLYSAKTIDPQSDEVLSDCADMENRARIGFYVDFYNHVSSTGSELEDPAKRKHLQHSYSCLDLAINSGFTYIEDIKTGDAPLLVSSYGVGERPSVWGNGSSWMAPVGLSMINRFVNDRRRSGEAELSPRDMIDSLKKSGNIGLYDPIYHNQFESSFKKD